MNRRRRADEDVGEAVTVRITEDRDRCPEGAGPGLGVQEGAVVARVDRDGIRVGRADDEIGKAVAVDVASPGNGLPEVGSARRSRDGPKERLTRRRASDERDREASVTGST